MGMKSKFTDFFPIYVAQKKSETESLSDLKKDIAENEGDWSYFEKQLGEYTKKFTSATKKAFISQVKDFENSFIAYLKQQESNLSFENSASILTLMTNALLTYYSVNNLHTESSLRIKALYDSHLSENHRYNFINFNYTSVLENCLKVFSNSIICKRKFREFEKNDGIGKIVHVHGSYDSFPLMGLNDESQIANKELANDKSFVRYIVKPLLNAAHRMNYDKESTELISTSKLICVYGMSLGETDKKWWDIILNWLSKDSARQLIIFDYDEQYTSSNQFSWLEKEDSIIDKLAIYSSNESLEIETLRPRIHIAVNKNIFQMDLTTENNENIDIAV